MRYETQADYHFGSFFAHTGHDGWNHTDWDATKVVFVTEHKAHVAVDFTRYREDGAQIGQYFSLYVVTRQNGHWGIQVGSRNG